MPKGWKYRLTSMCGRCSTRPGFPWIFPEETRMFLRRKEVVDVTFCLPSWPGLLNDTRAELSMVPPLCLPFLGCDSPTEGRRERKGRVWGLWQDIFHIQDVLQDSVAHSRISFSICWVNDKWLRTLTQVWACLEDDLSICCFLPSRWNCLHPGFMKAPALCVDPKGQMSSSLLIPYQINPGRAEFSSSLTIPTQEVVCFCGRSSGLRIKHWCCGPFIITDDLSDLGRVTYSWGFSFPWEYLSLPLQGHCKIKQANE